MNSNKQSSVEWLFEELFNSFEKFNSGDISFAEYMAHNLTLREQAKEIEKGQIIKNDPLPCLPNARLMAAAPEMFDALRDLYNSSILQSIPFDTALQKAITLYEELTDE